MLPMICLYAAADDCFFFTPRFIAAFDIIIMLIIILPL